MRSPEALTYQPIANPRFTVELTDGGGEQIRIKARRQIFAMLFLPLWLAGWTVGGMAALWQLTRHFEPFLVIWLLFWATAWVAAASVLVWMFAGSETLRVVGRDLEVAQHAFGWSRRWLYEGSRISNLREAGQPGWPYRYQMQVPFFMQGRTGAIKFDYGPRTVFAAAGLDDAEGRMIIEQLRKRLPGLADGSA